MFAQFFIFKFTLFLSNGRRVPWCALRLRQPLLYEFQNVSRNELLFLKTHVHAKSCRNGVAVRYIRRKAWRVKNLSSAGAQVQFVSHKGPVSHYLATHDTLNWFTSTKFVKDLWLRPSSMIEIILRTWSLVKFDSLSARSFPLMKFN